MADKTFEASAKRSLEIEHDLERNPQNYNLLTGERPTGRLHLGHLFGSILGRVKFQRLGVPAQILIADYQVITDRDEFTNLRESVIGIVKDNIAAGLSAEDTIFFAHSGIPELNQLLIPFLSLVSEAELHRNPTVKAELEAASEAQNGRSMTGLMLTYPVHQAADILFCKGNLVPVGKDQLPHIEITRVIARRFNERFCGVDYSRLQTDGPNKGQPVGIENAVFPEPDALLSKTPNVPGLDGRKMSKSFGNAVYLGATAEETAELIKKSPTDSTREISFDPENRPEVSALLTTCALCRGMDVSAENAGDSEREIAEEINRDPKYGGGLLKMKVTEAVNDYLAPLRARRAEISDDEALEILRTGNVKAREMAVKTLDEVSRAMGMVY